MAVTAMRYVGRLAPSPTGLLHLGHARTFWIAAQRARVAGGVLWLRDEDLDPQRSRADFANAMREDLRWLGIKWDAEMRQSERLAAYGEAMLQLVRSGFVYSCKCSRKDLQQAVQAPHEDEDEPIYSGRCRPEREKPGSREFLPQTNYRFRVPDGEVVTFIDGEAGEQSFIAGCEAGADFGDFVVWRKDGLPSYQLACVVDDAAMGVTEVVRGQDLLRSTARQILLQRRLGLATPRYFHCELMRDEAGVRLAKRHDALSLRALREAGCTPAEVIARLNLGSSTQSSR
ncbi:MAG TPA: tRNA glutamyl-Q(34) synthetase GluQRS [Acidobacteriaceae bacterium]|nr:tRNA glutamyl-Q(34) synthetase GluQRS [Acidobacteriaceae bacterium]